METRHRARRPVAVGRHEDKRDRPVGRNQTIGAHDHHIVSPGILIYRQQAVREAKHPRDTVIIENGEGRRRVGEAHRQPGVADGIAQQHQEVFVAFHRAVIDQDHPDIGAQLARRKGEQRVRVRNVITRRHRRVIRRGELHVHRLGERPSTVDRQRGRPKGFIEQIRRARKGKGRIGVTNRQHGIGVRIQQRHHRIGQIEIHRAVHIRDPIVNQRHHGTGTHLANPKRNRHIGANVINPGEGAAVLGQEGHRHVQVAVAGPDNRGRGTQGSLIRRIGGGRKFQIRERREGIAMHRREARPGQSVDIRETAPDVDFRIRLDIDCAHRRVRTRAQQEGCIHRPVRLEAGHAIQSGSVDVGEGSTQDHLVVRSDGHTHDRGIRTGPRIKCQVERAVGIQPGNPVAGDSVDQREVTANQYLPVRL